MNMKRTVSVLLALVMLFGVFAGCGQQGGETQSGTEPKATQESTQPTQAPTEPEKLDPPRTAEDFIDQLSNVLKERNIPVELVFERADDYQEAGHRSGYAVRTVDENGTQTRAGIMLWLFTEIGSESLTEVRILTFNDTPQQGWELYPVLCGIASALCDVQMTEEKVAELFAAEPAPMPYVTYTDDIGSYSVLSSEFIPDLSGFGTYKTVFCQPADLTHSLLRIDEYEGQFYKITFTESGENLYADKAFAVTVQELEDGINAWFNAEGIPIECAFQAIGRDEIDDVVRWEAFFRFTSLDDPDYQYPTSDLFIVDESQSMAYRQATMNEMVSHYIDLYVDTRGCYSYYPIVSFSIYVYEGLHLDGLIPAVCALWDSEMGNSTITELYSEAIAEEGRTDRSIINTEDYQLYVYPHPLLELTYLDGFYGWEYAEPENLLDPELLEYKYTTSEPVVQDGLFNLSQHYTDIFNISVNSVNLQQISPVGLIHDYLKASGAPVYTTNYGQSYIIPMGDFNWFVEYNNFVMSNTEEFVDNRYFGTFSYDFIAENFGDEMYAVYYSESAECLVDVEYVIRAAIGYGQMLDEGMTAEEAVQLHTTPQETVMTYGNWEVSQYCPREVMHIICKNVETGMTIYYLLPEAFFEGYFGDLEGFASDFDTLNQYEYLLENGWLGS